MISDLVMVAKVGLNIPLKYEALGSDNWPQLIVE